MNKVNLVYINDYEDKILKQQKEYYDYVDKLDGINQILRKVSLDEIDSIVSNWNKDEVIRYLLNIIKQLKSV